MAHPSIVRIYDAGEEESTDANGNQVKTPFIIMELVKGRLLRTSFTRAGRYCQGVKL